MRITTRSLVLNRPPPTDILQMIEDGLPWRDLEELAHTLGLTNERLAELVGITTATLYRRRKSGEFTSSESDHIVRFARLWWLALDVFENDLGAQKWLSSPQLGLAGAVPLEYARTEAGAREVEDLLRRIDYGVLA